MEWRKLEQTILPDGRVMWILDAPDLELIQVYVSSSSTSEDGPFFASVDNMSGTEMGTQGPFQTFEDATNAALQLASEVLNDERDNILDYINEDVDEEEG